jgi:hypothetical protein
MRVALATVGTTGALAAAIGREDGLTGAVEIESLGA